MGGNVFKDPVTGKSLTKRINRIDVLPTLKTLEHITKLDLQDNILGTTGVSETSGDLDVAVDVTLTSKDQLTDILTKWAKHNWPDDPVKNWVAKTGISVHFRAPICGDSNQGFVQVDFMFGNPVWLKWSLRGEITPGFAGRHRHILMSNLAKNRGYRWSANNGVMTRDTGIVLTNTPEAVSSYVLGIDATIKDVDNIDSIMHYIKKFPSWQTMISEAEETLSHEGISLLERYDIDRQRISTP
jgi:hypothetical protein